MSLLIAVAGWAVVGIGIAASPVSLAFESPYGGALVGAFLGAAMGGYLRHRVSDRERAPLWAPDARMTLCYTTSRDLTLPDADISLNRLVVPARRGSA